MTFEMIYHVLRFAMQVLFRYVYILIIHTWYFNKITFNGKWRPLKINTQRTDCSHTLISNHITSDKFLQCFIIFKPTSSHVGDCSWRWLSLVKVGVIFPVLITVRHLHYSFKEVWVVALDDGVRKLAGMGEVLTLWDQTCLCWKFSNTIYFR